MDNLAEFFHMGGYAWYVWPSYALAFVVLMANVFWSSRQLRVVHDRILKRASQLRRGNLPDGKLSGDNP
ncbi:MAG: heme exporter protein CcmD [Granulosicoccus sp.]